MSKGLTPWVRTSLIALALVHDLPDNHRVIVSLDIGTSSARARIHDERGAPVPGRAHQEPYEPTTTAEGGVEHDPDRLLRAVVTCLDAALAGGRGPEMAGVGVASFWHGLLGFDAGDRPATPIFTWADTRAARDADVLRHALDEDRVRARTGCHIHASYWPAKLHWLGHAQPATFRGAARWGSIGEYLELTFFGEATTSISMASATGLFDQRALTWDAETLAAAGIDHGRLFPLCDLADGRRGLRPQWARRWPALARATWFPALGDGATSTIGSDCIDRTRISLNVGTSAALRFVADEPLAAPRGLWSYRVDRQRALVGGATSEGGNVYAWLGRVLHLPPANEVEMALAEGEPDAHGLTVLPFLAGERSPGWRSERRATISGLSLDTTALDIMRAGLEAVALRLAAVYEPPRAAGRLVPRRRRVGRRSPVPPVGADDRRRSGPPAHLVQGGGSHKPRQRAAGAPVPGAALGPERGPSPARGHRGAGRPPARPVPRRARTSAPA